MGKNYKTEAVVLKTREIGEKSRVAVLLSPTLGKFEAVVKGSRKITGSMTGKIEPINQLDLMLASGKNLDVITQCRAISVFPAIRENLKKTSAALYMLDLLNRSLDAGEENRRIYNLLINMLKHIERGVSPAVVNRAFELKLIENLGYKPNLKSCAVCGRSGDFTYLDYHLGGSVCPDCRKSKNETPGIEVSPGTLKSMRFLMNSWDLVVSRFKADPEITRQMRTFLQNYIRYNVPGTPVNEAHYRQLMEDD